MVVINERDANYVKRLMTKLAEVVADMVTNEDYAALYEFGNQVNGLAARRGLPYDEPITLINVEGLSPGDFDVA